MHRGLGGSWLISWPRSWLRINRWPGHFHIGAVVTTLDAGRPVWTPAATSRPTIFTCKLDIICQLGWVNPCSDDSNHLERKQGQRYGRTYVLYQRNVHWFVNRLSSSAAFEAVAVTQLRRRTLSKAAEEFCALSVHQVHRSNN